MLNGPQAGTVASLVLVWTLATAAVACRMVARRMTRIHVWADDYFCLAAYTFCTASNAWQLVWLKNGFGLQFDEITWLSHTEALCEARRAIYFMDVFNTLSLGSSKVSMLSLYWRLFRETNLRYAIMYLIFLSLLWQGARTTVGLIRCIPAAAYWEHSVQGACFVDETKVHYAGSFTHLALVIAIIVIPLFELRKMRLDFWPKLGVIAIFLLAVVICICAIIAIALTARRPVDGELAHSTWYAALFGNIEINLSVTITCLPLLSPIFRVLHINCRTRLSGTSSPADDINLDQQHHHQLEPRPEQQQQRAPDAPPRTGRRFVVSEKRRAVTTVTREGGDADGGFSGRSVHVRVHREFGTVSPPEAGPSTQLPVFNPITITNTNTNKGKGKGKEREVMGDAKEHGSTVWLVQGPEEQQKEAAAAGARVVQEAAAMMSSRVASSISRKRPSASAPELERSNAGPGSWQISMVSVNHSF